MSTGYHPGLRIPTRRDVLSRLKLWRTDLHLWRLKRAYRRNGAACSSPQAAFVVGCQRSGTDMILWTLDKSRDVDRYDEDHRAAFEDCRLRGADVRRRLVADSNARRVIFKPVCDTHRTAALLAEHDGAKAVFVYRHYLDVAKSSVARWKDMHLRWLREVAEGGGDWGRRQWNRELITPQRQAEVIELVGGGIDELRAACVFWYLCNQTFFDQKLNGRADVAVARYEDVVARPAEQFRRLCTFLDVEYRDEMIEGIFTSSARKHTPPAGDAVLERCEALLARLDAAYKGSVR